MARIFMTGFEAGSLEVVTSAAATISTAQKRTGAYSAYIEGNNKALQQQITPASELYVRLGLYMTGGYWGPHVFMQAIDSSGAIHITFGVNQTTRALEVRRGNYGGTLLGRGAALSLNTWYCYEYRIVIDNTLGVVQVKRDGEIDIDLVGTEDTPLDTQNGGNGDIGTMRWGGDITHSNYVMDGYVDDIAINDTSGTINNSWIGQGGIYALVPNGAGTLTQLTPSAGSNYECVDDVPPDDDTSYVESDVQDEIDTYAMSASAGAGTISAVQWLARVKANSAGSTSVARVLRVNGTNYVGSDMGIDVDYVYAKEILEINPDDSAAWESADLDALEAGLKVR